MIFYMQLHVNGFYEFTMLCYQTIGINNGLFVLFIIFYLEEVNLLFNIISEVQLRLAC